MATCPECDAEIEIDDDDLEELEVGDPWLCDECASQLRVATLEPLEFDADDDDDDDDDEVKEKVTEDDTETIEDEDDDDDEEGGDWDE